MASTVSTMTGIVTVFTLTIVIATLSTSAVNSSGATCQHPTLHSIVKTTVTPREPKPGHDGEKAAGCSIYEVEVTNHITISLGSEPVTKGTPHLNSSVNNNNDSLMTITKHWSTRSDYEKYDGVGFYKLHESPRTWSEAKKICEEEGAHLVIINSKAEEEVIKKVMNRHRRLFVGFRYLREENYYETVLGQPLNSTGYVNWDEEADTSDSDELCGAVWFTGEIVNVSCSDDYTFICELSA
ncbi:hemolymph lipopolysaccharide-binding protein-like [Schistocerca piceifrons]|uniref:hemolymph lipopolysaccharide-binding protein-like n=1 Tax=Schistocerca piceifrons TaxID=274613 RepID=UPI001F5EBEAD|nr:hemolymph lipopolysaccharide-binding protein-like [Schistocerca piceifrons]